MEFKKFRQAFMELPCQIIKTGRRIVYRLLSWNRWLGVFFRGFWSGSGAVCIVNFGELAAFCDHWLETGAGIDADLDKNQKVDFVDYSIFAELWLSGCPFPWELK